MHETEALVINTGPLLALISGYGDLSLLKKIGLDFSMQEVIKRMQANGIYLSQKVIDFALMQVDEA